MYWRISILQDIYLEYVENMIKVRHQRKCNADPLKANRRKAHVPCKSRPSTDVAVAQTNSETDHAMMVERGTNPGVATSWAHLHPAVH
jgi:hypothetical protein